MNVYKKLMAARLELQRTPLKKSGHNKFAGYSYFELGDFLPTVQEIFVKHKLAGVVSFASDIATLRIVDIEDGQHIEITSPMSSAALKGCHEVQNLGAVQTYLRRYLWVTALEIVEHDAIDSQMPVEGSNRASEAISSLEVLRNAKTIDDLRSAFTASYALCKTAAEKKAVMDAKNKRKAELDGTT